MKKGKKQAPLNSMDKMICDILNISAQNAADFRKKMDKRMELYTQYSDGFGLAESPSKKPVIKDDSRELFEKICNSENMADYAATVNLLVAGYWHQNRVVYYFTRDVLEYIDNELNIEKFVLDMQQLQERAAESPIVIVLPAGYQFERAFLGAVSFFNDEIYNMCGPCTDNLCNYIHFFKRDNSVGYLCRSLHEPVSDILNAIRNDKTDAIGNGTEEHAFLMKLIAYIGYMRSFVDVVDDVFIESSIKNGVSYKVLPPKTTDIIPDMTHADGWMRTGLSLPFGYFSRNNMIKDFYQAVQMGPAEYKFPIDCLDREIAETFTKRMVLNWEANRNFYQFSNGVALYAAESYLTQIIEKGIPTGLLDYMPYHVMALRPTDTAGISVALITRCTFETGESGVFIAIGGNENDPMAQYLFRENYPLSDIELVHFFNNITPEILSSLFVLMHILTTLQRKANRHSEPTAATVSSSRSMKNCSIPDIPVIRQSSSITNIIPIALYDLTKKAVKRVPDKEAAERGGWKMVPHVRRRHPHRYWVGTGENRHLEVRWLENMNINQDKDQTLAVTVHSVTM